MQAKRIRSCLCTLHTSPNLLARSTISSHILMLPGRGLSSTSVNVVPRDSKEAFRGKTRNCRSQHNMPYRAELILKEIWSWTILMTLTTCTASCLWHDEHASNDMPSLKGLFHFGSPQLLPHQHTAQLVTSAPQKENPRRCSPSPQLKET